MSGPTVSRTRAPRRTAMTLVEVMVSLSLLLMVSGAMMYLLVTVKQRWQSGVSRASVRQDLQTTLWQMAGEMRDSEGAVVTDGTQASPVALSFPSACDTQNNFITDSGGSLVWQKFVIYYIPTGTTRLLRKEVYSLPSTPPIQLTQAQMVGYCDGTGGLVATGVSALTLSIDSANGAVTLGLTMSGKSAQGTSDVMSSSLYLEMRN